jgi:hypothetical protein
MLAVEHQTWVPLGCRERRVVLVETHLRGREAACGGRLADRLRTCEDGPMVRRRASTSVSTVRSRWPRARSAAFKEAAFLGTKIVPIITKGLYATCRWHCTQVPDPAQSLV